jgi:pimeloyl-ACP methyl ester carboxylesterase
LGELNFFYETRGAGEPLILIPGFASGAWTWYRQIEDLSKNFRVVTFDPRGIGKSLAKSENDLQNLSMETFVEDIAGLLGFLKIERANVLGASFGGFVAQEFALRFPERLDKLILACTSAGGRRHVKPDIEILSSFTPDPRLPLSERTRKFFRPAFTEEFHAAHPEEVEKVCCLREENEVAERTYSAQLQAAFSFDSENKIGAIKHETLVITGDRDNLVPMQNSINLAEKLPNLVLKIIENGSHMLFIENADEFNKIVSRFVLRH